MIHVTDEKTLLGIAELRKEIPQLTKDLKIKTVIVMRRGKPVGVLQDYEEYEEKEKLIEEFEDLVLGHLAMERLKNSKPSDYLSEKEVLKRLKIKL